MNLVKYVIKTPLKTIFNEILNYRHLSELCEAERKRCEDALLVATNIYKEKSDNFGKDCDGCYVKWIEKRRNDFDDVEVKVHDYKCSKFSMNVPCDNKNCRYHKMNNLLHEYLEEYEHCKKQKRDFVYNINERIK